MILLEGPSPCCTLLYKVNVDVAMYHASQVPGPDKLLTPGPRNYQPRESTVDVVDTLQRHHDD